jgi:ankyrin repeat protein
MDGALINPALWIAACGGHIDDVRRLLAEEVDIEETGGPHATSPLYEAAFYNFEHVVEELLRRGADTSSTDDLGKTALHEASNLGHVGVVLLLLEHGADVSIKNNAGWTPLHGAAHSGREAIVFLLLENGADVASTSNAGWTPLHLAAVASRETVARVLLYKGADLRSKTNSGRTPEECALIYTHHRVVAMLRTEADRREAKYRARCEAFAMGHQERLGAGSRVRVLDVGVVRMILEQL